MKKNGNPSSGGFVLYGNRYVTQQTTTNDCVIDTLRCLLMNALKVFFKGSTFFNSLANGLGIDLETFNGVVCPYENKESNINAYIERYHIDGKLKQLNNQKLFSKDDITITDIINVIGMNKTLVEYDLLKVNDKLRSGDYFGMINSTNEFFQGGECIPKQKSIKKSLHASVLFSLSNSGFDIGNTSNGKRIKVDFKDGVNVRYAIIQDKLLENKTTMFSLCPIILFHIDDLKKLAEFAYLNK